MKVKQHLAGLWNQQYRSPSGMMGWLAGERMVHQHGPETAWTMNLLEIQPTDTVPRRVSGQARPSSWLPRKPATGASWGLTFQR